MSIATEAATDIRDFYQHGAAPATEAAHTGGRDVLVLSIDATGVNMIPADLREPPPLDRPGRSHPAPNSRAGNGPHAPAWRW